MKKHTIQLAILAITFLLSVLACTDDKSKADNEQQSLFFQQQEEQRQMHISSINAVLDEDSKIRSISNGDPTITAEEMRKIDLSNCPTDFSTAFVAHIHAWEDDAKISKAKEELNKDDGLAVAFGILTTLFKDEITPFSDHMEAHRRIDELAQQTKEKINETWKQVELIAVNYGGPLPQKK